MTALLRRLGSEEGSSTIEFVVLLPVFLILFMSSFELGMLLTRQVALDRALDLAVRDVRRGTFDPAEFTTTAAAHAALKQLICDRSLLDNDRCQQDLKLRMERVDPRNWEAPDAAADCADRAEVGEAVLDFTPGQPSQIMLLRACALYDPYFPTTGLGAELDYEDNDYYALAAASAYVVEPAD